MNHPEFTPWPSVADRDEDEGCPYCQSRDGEPHQVDCKLFVGEDAIEMSRRLRTAIVATKDAPCR
jgi:hypothetical protein